MKRAAHIVLALVSGCCLLALGYLLRPHPSDAQSGGAAPVYSIRVEIDGIEPTVFRGVEEIAVEREVIDYREAGTPEVVRKVPGVLRTGLLTLKFDPVPHGDALWTWFNMVLNGQAAMRKNMSVILLKDGVQLRRYNFLNAWPARWDGWRQVSPGATSPTESVAIAFEKMERA